MTDQQPCTRCGRSIDAMAGICPFCNWNQNEAPPPPEQIAPPLAAASTYKPPEPFNLKRLMLMGAGVVVMLVGAFFIGMVINRDGAPARAPETLEEQAAEHNHDVVKPRRADTPLVPAGQGGIEQQPITSAPVAAAPTGSPLDAYQRTDATAASADDYARMAQRAAAEKKRMAVLVDPRTLTGPAYAQGNRLPVRRPVQAPHMPDGTGVGSAPTRPAPARSAAVRTRPVPTYQPIPPVSGRGSAKFTLLVGPDGRVKEVNVEHSLAGGNMPALIGAIQSWRFRPATENGEPVSAPYSVEISFKRE